MSTVPYNIPILSEPTWGNPSNFLVDATGVIPNNLPPISVIAGGNRTYIDYWGRSTLRVTIDGSQSVDTDGRIVQYEWSVNGSFVKTPNTSKPILEISAKEGSKIYLLVTDDKGAKSKSNTVLYTVREPLGWEMDSFKLNQG